MTRRYDLDLLATNAELAERYHVRRSAITNWGNRYDDFPKPVHAFSGTPVWDVRAVDKWWANHIKCVPVQAKLPNRFPKKQKQEKKR